MPDPGDASGDSEALFRSYNILGLLAWNESRPFDAVELFRRAREAASARADTASLAKVWNNLGLGLHSLGEYREAREPFVAAREAAASLGEPLIEGRVRWEAAASITSMLRCLTKVDSASWAIP